jgi:DNA-binding XRE family transcriptional regulator
MKGDVKYMNLKEFLIEHGINQQWLAKQLGITYQALYVKLKGKGNFSLEQSLKIKRLLRLTEQEFEEIFG